MGFLNKVKNMFIEEVEVEEPVKKEVIQVKIPSPKVEEEKIEKKEEPIKREIKNEVKEAAAGEVKEEKEEKFVFPVYFDDKDFEKIEEVKKESTLTAPPKKEVYGIKKEEKVEKKIFKPTPIISPVYGILDKNYRKEEITSKKKIPTISYNSDEKIDIDSIRKKAYGTLEDDIDNNLFEKTSILFNDEPDSPVIKKDDDIINLFDEEPVHEPRHEKKDDSYRFNEFENDYEDTFDDEEFAETGNMIEEELNKPHDEETQNSYVEELNDSDLFNLIDSMYEKKEDE